MSNPPFSARLRCATSTILARETPCSAAIAVRTSRTSAASSMRAWVAGAAMSSSISSRSLSRKAARYGPAANVVTRGLRPEARMKAGNLVPDEFAHVVPLARQ